MIALEAPDGEARHAFDAWAPKIAQEDFVERADVEHLAQDVHRAHTQKEVRFQSYASLWIDEAYHNSVLAAVPRSTSWFRVSERLAFDRSGRPDEVRPWAGIKKTTIWSPVAGVDPSMWQARYTNHGPIASVNHATCVRDRQNVILDGTDVALGAVSELWWTDTTRSHPTVTTHETLRTRLINPGQRGFLK